MTALPTRPLDSTHISALLRAAPRMREPRADDTADLALAASVQTRAFRAYRAEDRAKVRWSCSRANIVRDDCTPLGQGRRCGATDTGTTSKRQQKEMTWLSSRHP
jgi:hypothetical protein